MTASSGEPMALAVGLSYSAASQPLAHFLANLELALRVSLKAHTKNCMEACGTIQVCVCVCVCMCVCVCVRVVCTLCVLYVCCTMHVIQPHFTLSNSCHGSHCSSQAHVWVASFPAHAVLLVDAVVWTQSVSSALARTGM